MSFRKYRSGGGGKSRYHSRGRNKRSRFGGVKRRGKQRSINRYFAQRGGIRL